MASQRLTLGIDEDSVSILDSFKEEAANIGADVGASFSHIAGMRLLILGLSQRAYKIRERPKVHASFGDKVGHSKAGDIDSGRAWKSLRRASDLVCPIDLRLCKLGHSADGV